MTKRLSILRTITALILCLLSSVCVSASNERGYQPQSRVTWDAFWELRTEGVTERERATLWLTITSNSPISGQFSIEPLKVLGLFIEPSDRPSYSHQNRDGQRFYLANYRYDIYPSRAGTFSLPELKVQVTQKEDEYQFTSDSYRVEASAQPREAMGAISTSNYSLSQKVTKTDIMSGGVVTRTITQSAKALPGYLIGQLPPLVFLDQSVELTHGRESHSISDYRGHMTGTKSSNLHYRFVEAGEYQLPAVEVTWWNNAKGSLEVATLPSIDVTVAAPPPPPLKERVEIALFELREQAPIWWYQNQLWVFLMGVSVVLAYWLRAKIEKQIKRIAQRLVLFKQTSVYWFIELMIAALKPQEAWQQAFYSWMRKKNLYSINRLPDQFEYVKEQCHQSGSLSRVGTLRCVAKWEFSLISNRWNLSDINPK
ncbi:hypothetical protein KP803_05785 [Vibrio sp. ZSDE26]|uniref:Protein BatD n=1 Tax=Vibrio amylolyticus TaxID=2847292 RepID=A0A9X1XGX9_9VIBR|nr:hypothetical protein [Vibrio amylolyticus]MCK6262784.1 hypothetical protein [Vibrio amylolyticus]